jgi:hypothetical protein
MPSRTRNEVSFRFRPLLGLVLAAALLLVGAAGAQAATFTVNTTADNAPTSTECSGATGDCSLRQAIDKSNGTTSDDTITLPAGHYTLTITGSGENNDQTGDLDINKATGSVTIAGAPRSTTIDATGLGDRVLQVVAGTATISGITFTGGSPPTGQGGAILNNATVSLVDSTLIGNRAPSSNSDGGGIASPGTAMTLLRDTITGNTTGEFGGGVDIDGGTASITNTTITNNIGPNDGGGVDIDTNGAVAFVNDTINGNSTSTTGGNGGGVWIEGSNVSFLNTIVANNTGLPGHEDCNDHSSTDLGHNLDSTGTCFTPSASNGDITANPVLGPLQNNGGQTDTEALLAGSPAINAGSNTGCPSTDQRGVTRPQGLACDIGAYEAAPPIVSTGAATAVTTTSATLHGTVNPDNLPTTYHFQYGTTTAYGHSTPSLSAGSDYAVHAVAAAISGLAPGTTYHFRIVATNATGTSVGVDRTFTTLKPRLSLTVSPRTAVAGHRVCYSLTAKSSGHGVGGVRIRFAGQTAHTSSRGKARVCVSLRRGVYHARATKAGFVSASAAVRVRAAAAPPPRFTG